MFKHNIFVRIIATVAMAVILVSLAPATRAFAMENEDGNTAATGTVQEKAEKAAKKLATLGEYWGWFAEVGKPTTGSTSKATVKVTLYNSKHVWSNITITATANKATTYRYKGKNYPLSTWRLVLKEYKVNKDIEVVLKKKARTDADKLSKYAKDRGWTVKRSRVNNGNKNATETLEFHNGAYQFKATVVLKRGSEKFTFNYKRNDTPSTKKEIKDWLEVYKTPSQ